MLKKHVFLMFCLQSATVENECDRNCSNETRTCMDNLRKCTLMKKRNTIYRNMEDTEFDAMVSDSINTTLTLVSSPFRHPSLTAHLV